MHITKYLCDTAIHRFYQAKVIVNEIREKKALYISMKNQREKAFAVTQLEVQSQLEEFDESYNHQVQKAKSPTWKAKTEGQWKPGGKNSKETKEMVEKRKTIKGNMKDLDYSISWKENDWEL